MKRQTLQRLQTLGGEPSGETAGGNENWLMSYADIITLLLCFFILFYAVEKATERGDDNANPLRLLLSGSVARPGQMTGKVKSTNTVVEKGGENSATKFDQSTAVGSAESLWSVEQTADLSFTLPQDILFESRSVYLKLDALQRLDEIVQRITSLTGVQRILVKGHSDSRKLSASMREKFVDNWHLSGARAAAVARQLMKRGIDPTLIATSGRSYMEPLFAETDESGRQNVRSMALNRRVEIEIQLKTASDSEGS